MSKPKKNVTVNQFGILEAIRSSKVDGSKEWLESIDNRFIPGLIKSGCLTRHHGGVTITRKGEDLVDSYRLAKTNLPYREQARRVSNTVQMLLSLNKDKIYEIRQFSGSKRRFKIA